MGTCGGQLASWASKGVYSPASLLRVIDRVRHNIVATILVYTMLLRVYSVEIGWTVIVAMTSFQFFCAQETRKNSPTCAIKNLR